MIEAVEKPWVEDHLVERRESGLLVATPCPGIDLERPWVLNWWLDWRPSGLVVASLEPPALAFINAVPEGWGMPLTGSFLKYAMSYEGWKQHHQGECLYPEKGVDWAAWDQQVTTNSSGEVWGKPTLTGVLEAMKKIKEQIGEPVVMKSGMNYFGVDEASGKDYDGLWPIITPPIDFHNTSIAGEYFKKITESLGVPYRIFNPPYHADKPDWITEAGWREVVDGELEFERRLSETAAGRWAAEVGG